MDTRFEPLAAPLSTADAELPDVLFERGHLRVRFRDWREQLVTLLFHDVVAFAWDQGGAALNASHRDDCSYEVLGSGWLQRHIEVGTIEPDEAQHHYKLCFNAAGVLQVLASRLEVVGSP